MSTPEDTQNSATSSADNTWRDRPNTDKIPCPALLTFYNNNMLNPDKQGNVTTAHMEDVLEDVGLSKTARNILVNGAEKTDGDPKNQQFNLFALRDTNLDHHGSTGIRDPEVNLARLQEALLRFSENDRLYAEHFAAAASYGRKQDPGKGSGFQLLEFAALLEVFGRIDDSQKRYLTVDDVTGLWMNGKLPQGWQRRKANEIGLDDLIIGIAEGAVKRLLQLLGLP